LDAAAALASTPDYDPAAPATLRAATNCQSHTRPLTEADLDGQSPGAFLKPWLQARVGVQGAEAWKQSQIEDWKTWIVPASLLMTVSFSLIAEFDDILIEPQHGYLGEAFVRWVVAHVYLFCMASSAMLALKSINDYAMKILFSVHLPATLLPQARAYERAFKARQPVPWCSRLLTAIGVEPNARSYKLSIDLLAVGLTCAIFLRFGASFALVTAAPLFVVSRDMRHHGHAGFIDPWTAFVEKVDTAATSPDEASPRIPDDDEKPSAFGA
jgi:hypothetical protein